MFLMIILLGIYMNDLKVIWSGHFEDPEFMNNDDYRSMLIKTEGSEVLSKGDLEGLKYGSSISSKPPSVLFENPKLESVPAQK